MNRTAGSPGHVHTLEAVLQGNGRGGVRVEERAEGFGVQAKILQLPLDLLQALLELAVGNGILDPVGREIWRRRSVSNSENRREAKDRAGANLGWPANP